MDTQGHHREPLDLEVAEFNAEPPPPPKVVKFLRGHDRFPEIHFDVIEGKLNAGQICKKYDLHTKQGNYAVNAVLRYRAFLDERFAPLFAKANELQQEILRNEFLDKHRTKYDLAQHDHEQAMKGKRKNFGAAKGFLEEMGQSASEIGKAVQIGLPQQKTTIGDTTNVKILMALPKAQANVTPIRVIEASKTA